MRAPTAVLVAIACGCGSSATGGTSDAGPGADEVSILSLVTVSVSGMFGNEPPLAGVEVCVDGTEPPNCVKTGEDGRFVLGGLAPNTNVLLVYSKDGFIPMLQPMVTPRWSTRVLTVGHVRMAPLELWEAPVTDLNAALRAAGRREIKLDPGLAIVFFGTGENGNDGSSDHRAVLDPASGDGPFFDLWPEENLVPEIPAGAVSAGGVYYNVEPRDDVDDYELVFTRDGSHCRYGPGAFSGWPPRSGRENASRIVTRAGHETWWTVQECPFDPSDAGADEDAAAP